MAKTTSVPLEVADLTDSDVLTSDEQDIVSAIGELEGSEDARWQVTRIAPVPVGKVAGYCETFGSSEISKEMIRKACGKGRYRVRGVRGNGQFLKQFTLEIATDPPTESVLAANEARHAPTDFLTMMQAIEEKRSAKRLELLTILAPVIAAVVPQLFNRDKSSVQDTLAIVAALRDNAPKNDSAANTMDMMFRAMEFGRDSASGKSESWIDVAKDALGAVAPMLVNKVTSAQAPVISAPPSPALITSPTVTHESESMNVLQLPALISWAKQTLAYLRDKAAKGGDPTLYADWLLDNGPPNADITPFLEYLARDNWWQTLQQFDASIAPYNEWFAQLRAAILEPMDDSGDSEGGTP